MLRHSITLLGSTLTLALFVAGCSDDGGGTEEVGDTGTETAGTSETTAATETGTGTAEDTTTTTTTTDTTTDTTTETTAADTTTETTAADTTTETTAADTTTGGDACAADPNDDVCTMCLKDNCCDEVTTCYADPDCACVADCFQGGGDPFTCLMQCGVMQFPPALQGLAGCTMQSCGNECGL